MRLGPYLAVMGNCFKQQLTYRVDLFTKSLNPFLFIAFLWFVWSAVFASSPTPVIGGFTFPAMITYVSIAAVMRTYVWLNTEYDVEQDVKSGSIASILIKPLSYPFYRLSTDLGTLGVWLSIQLPLILFAFLVLGISGPASPLFFVSAFLGYLVNYFMVFLTAVWAFWITGDIWGLRLARQCIGDVASGALMPLSLFPLWLQGVFSLLPFQAVFYIPLSIYMGMLAGYAALAAIAVQLAWIGMLFAVAWVAWRFTMRKVVVQGG